jgi:hypothetical protein
VLSLVAIVPLLYETEAVTVAVEPGQRPVEPPSVLRRIVGGAIHQWGEAKMKIATPQRDSPPLQKT